MVLPVRHGARAARQGIDLAGNWVREMTTMILTGTDSGVTAVPNGFLDRYLPQADGEYVKIYLILWRCFCQKKSISVAQLADLLEDTEKDVLRGIRYWVKKGLMQTLVNDRQEIYSIRFLPIPEDALRMEEIVQAEASAPVLPEGQAKTEVPVFQSSEAEAAAAIEDEIVPKEKAAAHTISKEKRKALAVDEEFGQLVYIVSKYLERPTNKTNSDILGYLYGELGMRADLLEYLVESCVEAGHKSIHYIEKVALNWHEQGIRTVDEAREQVTVINKQYYQVLKAFGQRRRDPSLDEIKTMHVWFYDYGFQVDIIVEACNRTMNNIHEPSFKYAGGILADWKKKGVRSRGDIEALDQAFAREQETKKGQRKEAAKPNRFHNFDQVGYDYDAIVKELNG